MPGSDTQRVPRQFQKVDLVKAGFKIDGVQFRKEWSSPEVVAHIRGVFGTIMHAGVE